jgi:hypothetical protein
VFSWKLVTSPKFLGDHALLSFDQAGIVATTEDLQEMLLGVFGMGGGLVVTTELWDVIINLVVVSWHSTGKDLGGSIVTCRFVCK